MWCLMDCLYKFRVSGFEGGSEQVYYLLSFTKDYHHRDGDGSLCNGEISLHETRAEEVTRQFYG